MVANIDIDQLLEETEGIADVEISYLLNKFDIDQLLKITKNW